MENAVVVGAIEDHEPLAVTLITQPVEDQPENINLRVVMPGDFTFSSDLSICLLESDRSAGMHLKHQGL